MRSLSTRTFEELQQALTRWLAGDSAARDALVERSVQRLRELAQRELRRFPGLERWEQTDDVLQGALQRLVRALRDVRPATVRDFFALSTTMIRRELIDLRRHHFGPEGEARHHATPRPDSHTHVHQPPRFEKASRSDDPSLLAELTEFHERVEQLPNEECEVFGLLWYQGLTRDEAAVLLGISVRTVGRRWREARLRLVELVRHAG